MRSHLYPTSFLSQGDYQDPYWELQAMSSKNPAAEANIQSMISNLLQKNKQLQDKLNEERSKNFDLLELKRRLEENIKKLEFELERMGTYQSINTKETNIKANEVQAENKKLKLELDQYFQQIRATREELRGVTKQYQQLFTENQQLVNQNAMLLGQVAKLKDNVSRNQSTSMPQQALLQEIVTERTKEQISSKQLISPSKASVSGENSLFNEKMSYDSAHIPTRPSMVSCDTKSPTSSALCKKLDLSSPNHNSYQMNKIYEQFYEERHEIQPSPASFQNNRIQNHLAMNRQINIQSYKPRGSKQLVNQDNQISRIELTQQFEPQQLMLKTYQKNDLKGKVHRLRDQIIDELLSNSYKTSLNRAQQTKTNSLRIFIQQVSSNLPTLHQMTLNYLQAREALIEVCPTARKFWEGSEGTQNQKQIYRIYKAVKQSSKKQKTVPGQYLCIFRLLTLINKLEQGLNPLLLDNIKHSILKNIYKMHHPQTHNEQSD